MHVVISEIITFCVITLCVRKVITICVERLLHFALKLLLHFASMLLHFALVLHFAAILITFCVNITFCGDYYILRRNNPRVPCLSLSKCHTTGRQARIVRMRISSCKTFATSRPHSLFFHSPILTVKKN